MCLELKVKALKASASGAAHFLSEKQSSGSSVQVVVCREIIADEYVLSGHQLDSLVLTDEAVRLLSQGEEQFRSTYGDGFVAGWRTSSSLHGVLNVSAGSEEQKREIATKLKASVSAGMTKYSGEVSGSSNEASKSAVFQSDMLAWGTGITGLEGELRFSSMADLTAAVAKCVLKQGAARTTAIFVAYSTLQCYQKALHGAQRLALAIDVEFVKKLNKAYYELLFLEKEIEVRAQHVPKEERQALIDRGVQAKRTLSELSLSEASRLKSDWKILQEPDLIAAALTTLLNKHHVEQTKESIWRLLLKTPGHLPVKVRFEGQFHGGVGVKFVNGNTMRLNSIRFVDGKGAIVKGYFHNAIKKIEVYTTDKSRPQALRLNPDGSKFEFAGVADGCVDVWAATLPDRTDVTPDIEIEGECWNRFVLSCFVCLFVFWWWFFFFHVKSFLGNIRFAIGLHAFGGLTMRINHLFAEDRVVEFDGSIHNNVEWLEVYSFGDHAPKIPVFKCDGKDDKRYTLERIH